MEQPRAMQGSGKDRFLWLTKILQQGQLARYDMAVCVSAAQEPNPAARLARVDMGRLEYLRYIFAEIGFGGNELETRTRLFVGFHSMESALHSDLTEAEKKDTPPPPPRTPHTALRVKACFERESGYGATRQVKSAAQSHRSISFRRRRARIATILGPTTQGARTR